MSCSWRPGDAVSADCRLVEAHEVAVNNAALTGESDAVARVDGPVPAGPPLDARNFVFMGTDVVAGTGQGRRVRHRDGHRVRADLPAHRCAPRQQTPLQRQVAAMARRVAGVALATGALLFAVRVPSGQPFVDTFVFSLGVMVALVPEGLPATLSVSLVIGVRRMAGRRALVKQLLAVEALGSTSVVCTDKTGTLTQAEMTVVRLWANGVPHAVTGVGYAPVGEVADAAPVRELLRAAARAATPGCTPAGRDGWRVLGDTTEGALLVAAMKAGVDPTAEEARDAAGGGASLRFHSQAHEHRAPRPRRRLPGIRQGRTAGAARPLRCRLPGRRPHTVDGRRPGRDRHGRGRDGWSGPSRAGGRPAAGRRSSPAARRRRVGADLPGAGRDVRPAPAGGEGRCGRLPRAGIRIVMVTGDHPRPAEAVARRVGIVREQAPSVVTGTQLDALDDGALDALAAGSAELLLCRVSP